VGEACDAANTQAHGCQPDTFCVANGSAYGAITATCRGGASDEPCDEPEQCESGTCVHSLCSAGEVGDACTEDAHCLSGFCSQPEESLPDQSYTCGSGEPGTYCFDAHNCAQGICALQVAGNFGLCSTGEAGTFCKDGSECLSGTCSGTPPLGGLCDGKVLGDVCGFGICDAAGVCTFTRCE
jgi:hypothetical protein